MKIDIDYMTPTVEIPFPESDFNEKCLLSKQAYQDIKHIVKNNKIKKYFSLGHGGYLQYVIPKFIIDDLDNSNEESLTDTKWVIFTYDVVDFNLDINCERNKYFCENILEKYNKYKKNIIIYQFYCYFPLISIIDLTKRIDTMTSWIDNEILREQQKCKFKETYYGSNYDLMETINYDPNNYQEYSNLILSKIDTINIISYKWFQDENLFKSLKTGLFDKIYYFFNKLNNSDQQIYIHVGFYGSGNVTCSWYWEEYCITRVLGKLYPNLVIIGIDGVLFNNKIIKYEQKDHISFTLEMLD